MSQSQPVQTTSAASSLCFGPPAPRDKRGRSTAVLLSIVSPVSSSALGLLSAPTQDPHRRGSAAPEVQCRTYAGWGRSQAQIAGLRSALLTTLAPAADFEVSAFSDRHRGRARGLTPAVAPERLSLGVLEALSWARNPRGHEPPVSDVTVTGMLRRAPRASARPFYAITSPRSRRKVAVARKIKLFTAATEVSRVSATS